MGRGCAAARDGVLANDVTTMARFDGAGPRPRSAGTAGGTPVCNVKGRDVRRARGADRPRGGLCQWPTSFSSAAAASLPIPFDASGLSPVISLRS